MDNTFDLEGYKWYASQDTTEDKQVHDTGKGEPIVLRNFVYALNPGIDKPTKEQILTPEYIKHLQTLLWADSLRLVTEPSVTFKDDKYVISATCQARTGATIMEQPKYLQELL